MTIGLIGLGNMGSAVANLVASNGNKVLGWEYNADIVKAVNTTHENARYLPGISLHPDVNATGDLNE
ncbi:MAG TPA: glycerol-3-phosphate dehydrogenase, partial [Bacteroidetes bacterium]|nr:glycerol-3-phosphate dehydrogenase [Bacteroidota bacterium]